MKIKRYVDADMRTVLRRVREDQGPDAVILSNRRTDDGIEVIAAIDYDESILQQAFGREPDVADFLRVAEPATPGLPDVGAGNDSDSDVAVVAADLRRVETNEPHVTDETYEPDEPHATEVPRQAVAPDAAPARADGEASRSAGARGESESLDRMWSEISSIRGLMESQLSDLVWKEEERRSPLKAQVIRNLARLGISPDIAGIIVGRLDPATQARQVWRAPLTELVEMMPIADDEILTEGGVVALIGPTGVGKTTSVAKLAAKFAMVNGSDELALICADAYRIGAREHLSAFGQIIGARVHSVGSPAELAALLERLKSKKLVLIDTDGVGQRDAGLATRLSEYASCLDTVRFYLTLSAASQEATLDETIRRFSRVPLAGAVVSKIDEAGQLGCVMSSLIRNDLPALWFSDGQRIPDDFHEASTKKLWLLTQAIQCMDASQPMIDEHMMAQRYALASVAHA